MNSPFLQLKNGKIFQGEIEDTNGSILLFEEIEENMNNLSFIHINDFGISNKKIIFRPVNFISKKI